MITTTNAYPNVHLFDINDFQNMCGWLRAKLADAPLIHRGRVHAQDVASRPEYATYELSNVVVSFPMPALVKDAQDALRPNLPWADEHFNERVSGQPLNPAPSHVRWPYNQNANKAHTDDNERFSHTYPERIWPKMANGGRPPHGGMEDLPGFEAPHKGIRYDYGDLHDVLALLDREPLTRQAFLPIWFPEDTGAVEGQRVPCTIGYHFIQRGMGLDCQYFMRSCDLLRFFTDDAYMAVRLVQWMCNALGWSVYPGRMTIMISNLHAFAGDKQALKRGGL